MVNLEGLENNLKDILEGKRVSPGVAALLITNNMKYTLELTFNGETFTKETDNLKEAFMSMKPDFVHTEGYITITNEDLNTFQRRLDLVKLRKLFGNEETLDIFIDTLAF